MNQYWEIYLNVACSFILWGDAVGASTNAYRQIYSSVWMLNTDDGKKYSFQNICYNSAHNFYFILSNSSILSGLDTKYDLLNIPLSSVSNHSELELHLSIISNQDPLLQDVQYISDDVILYKRFKKDNIFHVIHDDILPIYMTYKHLCWGAIKDCVKKYRLAFVDGDDSGPFIELYEALSKDKPLNLPELSNGKTVCFSHVKTGISRKSVVYQYGFGKPQGPVNSMLKESDIIEFKNFFRNYFNVWLVPAENELAITVVDRKLTRRILNIDIIETFITSVTEKYRHNIKLTFNYVDLSYNTTSEILIAISSSRILIGMHGASMIFSLFLPNYSTVIELFPFGIIYKNVSPLHSFSLINNIHFKYFSWVNEKENHSVTHAEYPPLLGGLEHLSTKERRVILNTLPVPAVHCCHNPLYLFRMYQDTWVDDTLYPVVESALSHIFARPFVQDELFQSSLMDSWYFPSFVQHLECVISDTEVKVSWDPPVNIIGSILPSYNITARVENTIIYVNTRSKKIVLEHINVSKFEIWIFCCVNNTIGKTSYTICSKDIL